MSTELILYILEIIIFVDAVLLIIFSLFKQTSSQEVLASISGGSQKLFLNKKVKLTSSVLLIILFILTAILFSLNITLRIVINTNS